MDEPYYINNYNPVILKDIESDESLVICSSLGSGKSVSVKKYISMNKDKKILLVVNLKEDQKLFHQDLEDRVIYVDSDSRIKLKESVELLKTTYLNCVCITKVRFNYMVTVNTTLFDDFDKIIIDESNGINPLIQNKFENNLQNLLLTLGNVIKLTNKEAYEEGKSLLDFLYMLNESYINDKKIHRMNKLEIPNNYKEISGRLKDILLTLYNEDKINEYNIVNIISMLTNIVDDEFYLNEYNSKNGKVSDTLFCNKFLRDYIKEKNISIKILDGTAKFIKPLYDWLDIKIKEDYDNNLKTYPNMKIHYYKFDDVTPFEGRNDKDIKEKMLKFIEKENIPNDILLFTNHSSSEIFSKVYYRTEYAFGGKDVGSNKFRDDENLAVVFYNTLPLSFRLLWNKEIKGMSIEDAQSKFNLDMAEYELIGSMMVQLVGRTAIRKDNNNPVNIYMFCVPGTTARSIQHHYKIPRENIFIYECILDLRKKSNLAISGLFYLMKLEIELGNKNIDIHKIALDYYGDKLTKDYIKKIKFRHKEEFVKFAEKNNLSYYTGRTDGWVIK